MERIRIIELTKHEDDRGWLTELLRQEHLSEPSVFGQMYVTTAHPGITKANHYHREKTEWLTVIKGLGSLHLEDVDTGERMDFQLDDRHPKTIEIKPGVAHAIKNIGESELYVVIYTDTPFDPQWPDTYAWEVAV